MDRFYSLLQETIDSLHKRVMIIIMGDRNAKIEKRRMKTRKLGVHGLGTWNEKGDRLE